MFVTFTVIQFWDPAATTLRLVPTRMPGHAILSTKGESRASRLPKL